ncbi:RHS repeat-associated core domain-containing protein [Oscillospiraceae bacterium PP1C4]
MRSQYSYRPDGLRYSKTVKDRKNAQSVHIHLWDGQNMVAEIGATNTVTARFLRGINLISREQDGANQYYLFNAHGDVTQRYDTLGNLLKNYKYDAFGNEEKPEPLDSNPFRYCGEYFDKETGEIYLRARYYDPATGRFGAEDSVRSASYTLPNKQKTNDPLSLNLYVYCNNSPIRFFDPSGHYPTKGDAVSKFKKALTDTGRSVVNTGRYVVKGLGGSILALRDSAYIKGGTGTGFGGSVVASSRFDISLYDKADVWAFYWDSKGFHKISVKEAAAGASIFEFINFGQTAYSYEKQGWFDVCETNIMPWLYEGNWKDVSSKQIDNTVSLGGSLYWGFGGSFEVGFNLNTLFGDIVSAWS